ncbi:hypothetical protein KSF78_0002122 [Schistosoma japonicum]|nr:hypothetical protein KSF78_0002122 [Schistosoma japonicum]
MIIVLLLLCIPVLTVAKLDTVVFQVDVKLLTMSFLTDNKSTIASYVECNTNSCNGCFKVCIRSTSQSQCTVRIHYTTQHTNMVNKQLSFPRASHNEKLNGFRSTVFIPEEELMDAKLLDVPVFRKMTKWEKIDLLRYTLYPKEFIPKSGESTEWENVTLISKKKVLRLNIAFKVTYKLVDLEKYNNKQQKNAATNNTLTTDEVDKTMETNSNNEESVDIQGDNKQGNNTDISDKLRNDKELIDSIVTNSTNQGNDNNSGSDDQQHKTTDTHNSMTTESEIRNSTIIQTTNQANDSNSDSDDQEHKTTDTHNAMTTESEMRNSMITQPTNQANDNNSDSDDQEHKTTDTHNAMTTESEMRNSMITQPTNQANDNNSDSDDQQYKTTDTHNAMTAESEMRNTTIAQPTNQGDDSIPFWIWFICYLSKTIFRYDICPTMGYRSI